MSQIYHPVVANFMLANNCTCTDRGQPFDLVENDGKPHKLTSARSRELNVRPELTAGRAGLTDAERMACEAIVKASAEGKPAPEPEPELADKSDQ